MSSNLERAEQAVAEARQAVHEFLSVLAAPVADEARAAIERLGDAVRELAACEIEAHPGPHTDDRSPGYAWWWDTRDRDDAARIAREGLTKETT